MSFITLQCYASSAVNSTFNLNNLNKYLPKVVHTGIINLAQAVEDSGLAHFLKQEGGNPVTHALIGLGLIGSFNFGKGRVKYIAKASALTAAIILASNKEQFVIFLTTVIFTKVIQHYIARKIEQRNLYYNSKNIIHLNDNSWKKN